MQRILFFGDSLTAGYGLDDPGQESLPALIQQRINDAKLSFEVVNAGLSGDTSSGGLNRLDYWLTRPPDIFILELGINDVMRGVPTSATTLNLDSILKRVSQRHPKCKLVVMGMEIPAALVSGKIDEFRAIFRTLADKYNAAFVPFFLEGVAGMKHLNLRDGIHPSHKGYQIIADKIWPVIRPLVTKNADQVA
jgi:acyl-CoA thioesterase I